MELFFGKTNKNNELSGGFSCLDFQHMTVGIIQTWRIGFAPMTRPHFCGNFHSLYPHSWWLYAIFLGIWQSLAKFQMISLYPHESP
jgi:hypothetical protein